MTFVKRARTLFALVTVGLAACTGGAADKTEAYSPPPPLAMVVLVDPSSGQMPAQLHQLADVIRSSAMPNESVVVMMLAPGSHTYTVVRDDSLSAIAAANGVTLAELEGANPQFGPVAGRNWSLIHAGERVTVPDRTAPSPLLLVTRAPAGPSPPLLVRLPVRPDNPTDYQRAQYEHALASANATNASRIAAWKSDAAQAMRPWQDQVVSQLEGKSNAGGAGVMGSAQLSTSMVAGLATLGGLKGHRLMLVLGGDDTVPSLPAGSMSGVDLVVANLANTQSIAAWTAAGQGASATSVSALDSALTQLQLAQTVNK